MTILKAYVLQNNTKLNIALAEIRSKFRQHGIFQHLHKVLCLLIYCLLYFSELSEWLKPT